MKNIYIALAIGWYKKVEKCRGLERLPLKWSHHVQGLQIEIQIKQHITHEQEKVRSCLHKLFTSMEYLARQALLLRGHTENRGNLVQLLQLRSDDSTDLQSWLKQRRSYVCIP